MKILVATSRTQGARESDFNFCIDGELLWIAEPCATDAKRLPNSCGCGRAFAGLASHRATTTALVADLPMNFDEYSRAISASLQEQGWPPHWAAGIARDQTELTKQWQVGDVVERDLDMFTPRSA